MTTEEIGSVRAALSADPAQFVANLAAARSAIRGFSTNARNDLATINTAAATTSTTFVKRFGMVSLQLQDVAVQLGTGTNVMRIFAQQGSQVLSIFGPWGAIIGAGAAVVGTLATALFGAKKEATELPHVLDGAANAMDSSAGEAKKYADALKTATAVQKTFIENAAKIQQQAAVQSTAADLSTVQSSLTDTLTKQAKRSLNTGNMSFVEADIARRNANQAAVKQAQDQTAAILAAITAGDPEKVTDLLNKSGAITTPTMQEVAQRLKDAATSVQLAALAKKGDEVALRKLAESGPGFKPSTKKTPAQKLDDLSQGYQRATAEAQAFNQALADGTGTIAVQAHYAVLDDIQSRNLKLTQAQIDALEALKREQLSAAASRAELDKTFAAPGEASANARGAYRVQQLGLDASKTTKQTTVQVQILQSAALQAADGIASVFSTLKDGAAGAIQAVENLTSSIGDLILKQLILAGIGTALNAAYPGAGGKPGTGAGTDLGLPHFATGGSFRVGGTGGTDGQLVAFKATPGERVTVDRPGAPARPGGGGTYYIDARGADAAGMRRLQDQIVALNGSIETRAVAAIMAKGKRSAAFRGAIAG